MPNPMTQKAYLKARGGTCPFCRSGDITGEFIDVDDSSCTQEVSCGACEGRWYDIYKLTGYDTISAPSDEEKDEEGQ